MTSRNRVTSAHGAAETEAQATESSGHDEWLLDEALMETFPASDPTAPAIVSIPPPLPRARRPEAAEVH
jgi:hypothetical protein